MSKSNKPLGVADTDGNPISKGCYIKMATTNQEMHGDNVYYIVDIRGGFPVLSYVMSDKGYILPPDYTGCFLTDFYEPKQVIWRWGDTLPIPDDDLYVITKDELPFPPLKSSEWLNRDAKKVKETKKND